MEGCSSELKCNCRRIDSAILWHPYLESQYSKISYKKLNIEREVRSQ